MEGAGSRRRGRRAATSDGGSGYEVVMFAIVVSIKIRTLRIPRVWRAALLIIFIGFWLEQRKGSKWREGT
jgi:hypothetical protein